VALPTIIVNSATGSDTAASGAGPGDGTTSGSALTGSSASTSGTGLVVTLDGSPDLTPVATDGSHVIFLNDSTAGNRNFGKITAKDNVGKTVTVADAFGLSLSGKAWAIGGKRASIGGTTSSKLFDNNSAAGDAMPGWTVKMESGHAETLSATLNTRRSGDTTSGPIVLCGASGAATPPILTFSNNGNALVVRANSVNLTDFELQNSNATKTSSVAITSTTSGGINRFSGLKISHSTNKFWQGILIGASGQVVENCETGYCANIGISLSNTTTGDVVNSWIHDCGSDGIQVSGGNGGARCFLWNIVEKNSGNGIQLNASAGGASASCVIGNTLYNNTSDGLLVTGNANGQWLGIKIINNISANNGGYGYNFSSISDAAIRACAVLLKNNDSYANTSGATNPGSITDWIGDPALNPQFVNTGADNFAIGTNLKALGYPTTAIGKNSGTTSYADIGVAQRQESGGGLLVPQGWAGGFNG
jgi:hypothetical protein